jgi:uncharacterized protein
VNVAGHRTSSHDLDGAEALIAGGAAIDVPGGSIGTPVENAVGYGCRHVGPPPTCRGARVDTLWVAGMGLLPVVREHVERTPAPDRSDIDHAFWRACHNGLLRVAAYLLEHGADIPYRYFRLADGGHWPPVACWPGKSTR